MLRALPYHTASTIRALGPWSPLSSLHDPLAPYCPSGPLVRDHLAALKARPRRFALDHWSALERKAKSLEHSLML